MIFADHKYLCKYLLQLGKALYITVCYGTGAG